MTNAWFLGMNHSVPQTEEEVRSTVEPVRTDSVEAEAQDAPNWNEFESDKSGELVGLSPRVKGADTTDTEKYVPFYAPAASDPHNIIVDSQVASSGTAAAREMAGQQGHGTMQFADSIDPVIVEGTAFGNEFFHLAPTYIQDGAGPYMTPATTDDWNYAVAQAVATSRSRGAFMSTQYSSFLQSGG